VATQLDIALMESERRIIERKPTENSAAYEYYLRGNDYKSGKNVSDLDEAVRLYKKAVSLDPRFAEAWAALSGAYQFLYWVYDRPGTLALGTEAAERAEQLAPDISATQVALGRIHYHKREYSEALKHHRAAYRLQPNGGAALAIGIVLRRLGKYQEALDQFEEARRLNPLSYFIYYDALGYTNMFIRRFDEAERNIDHAILLDPSATPAYVEKAYIHLARDGDMDAARQVMLEMSRRTNIEEEAERVASGGLSFSDLRFHEWIYERAFDAFEAGPIDRYRTAQPAAIAAIHLYRALLVEAKEGRQEASARYDSARVYYERLVARDPQSAQVWKYHIHLGLAYAGLGRKEEAILEGEEAIRIMPASEDAFVAHELPSFLAEIYLRCGEHEKAIDQLETALSNPGYTTATLLRIDPLWDPIRAHPRFRRLLEQN
jgi:serine/threonine-protein kinase